MADLVLSLFPGIGLLDQAFEEQGYCVVRGPDLIWGGDVHRFVPPAGVFAGVIGGPPCQKFSPASTINGTTAVDLISEYERVVSQAQPQWWLMENVRSAPIPVVDGYQTSSVLLSDVWVGGLTMRRRRFTFGTRDGRRLAPYQLALHDQQPSHSVMASTGKRGGTKYSRDKAFLPGNMPVRRYGELQGAPEVADRLTRLGAGKEFVIHVLGNGVPLALGRAVAQAVADAMK